MFISLPIHQDFFFSTAIDKSEKLSLPTGGVRALLRPPSVSVFFPLVQTAQRERKVMKDLKCRTVYRHTKSKPGSVMFFPSWVLDGGEVKGRCLMEICCGPWGAVDVLLGITLPRQPLPPPHKRFLK